MNPIESIALGLGAIVTFMPIYCLTGKLSKSNRLTLWLLALALGLVSIVLALTFYAAWFSFGIYFAPNGASGWVALSALIGYLAAIYALGAVFFVLLRALIPGISERYWRLSECS